MSGQLTPQHYACLYSWFAGMFACELDDQHLAELQSADVTQWLGHLATLPALQPSVLAVRNRISTL